MFGELLQRVPWLGKASTPHLQVAPVFAMHGVMPATPVSGDRFTGSGHPAGMSVTRMELRTLFQVIGAAPRPGWVGGLALHRPSPSRAGWGAVSRPGGCARPAAALAMGLPTCHSHPRERAQNKPRNTETRTQTRILRKPKIAPYQPACPGPCARAPKPPPTNPPARARAPSRHAQLELHRGRPQRRVAQLPARHPRARAVPVPAVRRGGGGRRGPAAAAADVRPREVGLTGV